MVPYYTHEVKMRTNIGINDGLMEKVLKTRKFKTKKDAVDFGLRFIPQLEEQAKIQKYRGKLKWTGSLDEMRSKQ
jgi:Arc/MetJ family transcription regulator